MELDVGMRYPWLGDIPLAHYTCCVVIFLGPINLSLERTPIQFLCDTYWEILKSWPKRAFTCLSSNSFSILQKLSCNCIYRNVHQMFGLVHSLISFLMRGKTKFYFHQRVGFISLSNRFNFVSRMFEFDWLSPSLDDMKVRCRRIFLMWTCNTSPIWFCSVLCVVLSLSLSQLSTN